MMKWIYLIPSAALMFFSFPTTLACQTWDWATPVPTGDLFYGNSFVDTLHGWNTAGGSGVVFHTTDGGISWEPQPTGHSAGFYDIAFQDSLHGWLVGSGDPLGLILRTADGGRTWDEMSIPTFGGFWAVQAFGRDTCFALASRTSLLRTTDDGVTWSVHRVNQRDLYAMSFVNEQVGYVLGDSLYFTADAGDHWEVRSDKRGFGFYLDMYFRDSLTGWIASPSTGLSRTTDGGVTWEEQTPTLPVHSISFPTPDFGWVFGSEGSYWSSDSGSTWQLRDSVRTWKARSGRMVTRQTGFLAVSFGSMWKTTDGGDTWQELVRRATQTDLKGVAAPGKDHLWVVGGQPSTGGGEILFSRDNGVIWVKQIADFPSVLHSVSFIDTSSGWVCGDDGTLLQTSNSGATWSSVATGTSAPLHRVLFLDSLNGWCGGLEVVLRTRDGGKSWDSCKLQTDDLVEDLFFFDTTRGWAVSTYAYGDAWGRIYSTADGGRSWDLSLDLLWSPFSGIHFLDTLNGWAVRGSVMRTSDGGRSWSEIAWDSTTYPYGVLFQDSTTGWIFGFDGRIYATSDGGNQWMSMDTPTSETLYDLALDEGGNGYVIGSNGCVLRSSEPLVTEIRQSPIPILPRGLTLHPNYPNPFNPATRIRFELPAEARTTVEVFDLLGRKIRTLVDEMRSAGVHVVDFDASGLASGIYICRLRTNRQSVVRGMLLLR